MWHGDFTFELSSGGTAEAEAKFTRHLVNMRISGRQTILRGCCTRCMLYSVNAILGANSSSWHGEIWRDDLSLCSAMIVELWTIEREMGDEDENDKEGYERICAIRGMTCLIGLGWPCIGVIKSQIGTHTCCIRDGKLTSTWNPLKFQFHMMIFPPPSHPSLSCPQFYHHLRTQSWVFPLCLFFPWSRVDTGYSIIVVLATGPGNPPAVCVWTTNMVRLGSRTIQKPEPLLPGGRNLSPYPSIRGYFRVCLDPSGPISSFAFWVFLFMVTFRYPTVDCKILAIVLQRDCLMYWQPLYSKRVEGRSLPHPGNERPWSVNNWWSCILGNLGGAWSHLSRNKWFAGFMGKYASDIPAITSWTVTTYFNYRGVTKFSRAFETTNTAKTDYMDFNCHSALR